MTEIERARLDVIEAKIDVILVKLEYIEKQSDDHEMRMRSVEKWKWALPVTILVTVATIIGGWIGGH